jgi:hypothetical protein
VKRRAAQHRAVWITSAFLLPTEFLLLIQAQCSEAHQLAPTQVNVELDHRLITNDPRILTVYFGDLIHREKFKLVYHSITQHLTLPGTMIDYSFIQFWIDHQHPTIQEHIKRLATS